MADVITRGSEDTLAGRGLCAALPADTFHVHQGVEPMVGPTTTPKGRSRAGPLPAPTRGPAAGSAPPSAAARHTEGPDGADNMQKTLIDEYF